MIWFLIFLVFVVGVGATVLITVFGYPASVVGLGGLFILLGIGLVGQVMSDAPF